MKRFIGIFIYFLIFPLWGQEAGTVKKVCLPPAVNLSSAGEDVDEELFESIFKENFSFELRNAGFELISDEVLTRVQGDSGSGSSVEFESVLSLGKESGADVVISQFYRIDGSRILYGIKCYEVESERMLLSTLQSGRAGLTLSTTINSVIARLIPQLKEKLEPQAFLGKTYTKEIIVEEEVPVTVYKDPGKTVEFVILSSDVGGELFFGDTKVGVVSEEAFSAAAQTGALFEIRLRKEGFHSLVYPVLIEEDTTIVQLPALEKESLLAVKVEYSLFQFLGAGGGIRYYFNPDWFFADASNYFYMQNTFREGSSPVFHNDLNLLVGHYIFFEPDFPFRFNVFAGVGVIATFFTRPDIPMYFDLYGDILGFMAEWDFGPFILYYKTQGRYFYPYLGGLLGNSWISPAGMQFTFGGLFKW